MRSTTLYISKVTFGMSGESPVSNFDKKSSIGVVSEALHVEERWLYWQMPIMAKMLRFNFILVDCMNWNRGLFYVNNKKMNRALWKCRNSVAEYSVYKRCLSSQKFFCKREVRALSTILDLGLSWNKQVLYITEQPKAIGRSQKKRPLVVQK